MTAGGKGTAGAVATTVSAATSDGEEENSGPEITSLSPDSGPVGTLVKVMGTGFGAAQGNSTVSFDGVQGVPRYWSETDIRVPVPARAATGPVTVTVGGQQSNGVEFRLPRPLTISVDTTLYEGDPVKQVKVSVPAGEEPTTNTPVTFTFGGTATPEDDYEMAATVTLEAGKRAVKTDLEVVDDEPFEVPETLTLEAAAAGYDSSSVVTIVIYDDNYTPLTLTADPSSVAEPWGRSTVTVSVPEGKEPATDTVVSIIAFPSSTATKEIDYTLETELTILGHHRSAEMTLQVTDDAFDEGKERIKLIAHGDASSGLGQSSPLGIPLVDDDTAGVTVTPASLSLTEGGTTGTYQVSLDSEPTYKVLVTIDSDNADLQVTPAAVRFAPGNWSIPQAVTVAATHDDGYDDESGTLTHEATSGDPNYEGVAIDAVSVAVEDDEKPPLTLTVDTASVGEADGQRTATLTVTVPEGEAPSADATVAFNHTGTATVAAGDYAVGTLTIRAGELSGTATLEVTDDAVDEGEETILVQATHSDYEASEVVTATLVDDDTAGVTVTPTSLSLTEDGTDTTYQVRLDSEPRQTVTITIDSDNPDLFVDVVSLSFAPGNWSTPQTVTVAAAHDDGYDDESGTLTHEAVGDSNYEGIAIDDVTVTVDDDEKPPLTLTADAASVSEPNGTTTLTVSVPEGGAPDADTTIKIFDLGYARGGEDYRVGTLTIEKGDLSDTATLQVIDDTVYEGTEVIWLQAAKEGYKISPVLKIPLEDNERNQAPVVSLPLPGLTTNVGAASTVSLSSHFSDPEGHDLVYTATSSHTSMVTVSVSGSTLTLTGVAVGSSTITVTATDQPQDSDDSLPTRRTFTATVENRDPECEAIAGQTVNVNASKTLTVSCTDPDGHPLSYAVTSSATSKVTVSNDGASVTITGVVAGRPIEDPDGFLHRPRRAPPELRGHLVGHEQGDGVERRGQRNDHRGGCRDGDGDGHGDRCTRRVRHGDVWRDGAEPGAGVRRHFCPDLRGGGQPDGGPVPVLQRSRRAQPHLRGDFVGNRYGVGVDRRQHLDTDRGGGGELNNHHGYGHRPAGRVAGTPLDPHDLHRHRREPGSGMRGHCRPDGQGGQVEDPDGFLHRPRRAPPELCGHLVGHEQGDGVERRGQPDGHRGGGGERHGDGHGQRWVWRVGHGDL